MSVGTGSRLGGSDWRLRFLITAATLGLVGAACSADPKADGAPPSTSGSESAVPTHEPPTPSNTGPATRGGTMTFTNIGATGYWGRRIEASEGDPRCDVEARWISYPWGGKEYCCRTKHQVTTNRLSPYNEQMTLVLEGPLRVKQFAVYQPVAEPTGKWAIKSFWDRRAPTTFHNLHISGPGDKTPFTGDLGNNCAFYAMQDHKFPCGPGSNPYCPGSALDYDGWPGSKLVVLLASMPYADDPTLKPLSCIKPGEDERQQDAPWIGFSPSELNRDGWSGYHPCHCFANTNGAVGDGCGQINVFEVVAESSGSKWGNRDIISTGLRSFQVGSLGGSVCGIAGCGIGQFDPGSDLLDARALKAMAQGAVIDADNRASAYAPVWRRPLDDRYFAILLDEQSRVVQVMILHPGNLPGAARALLPALPNEVSRAAIDGLVGLRVPQ
ncbi:cell wall protein YJL171C/Tos1 domain-containing protein [Cystobacter fuscus]|uniref:cell wall protein YJL171C/Tos1 domain-containing protein n=1 Tax=Cystobacter fuscus TaxID=43 RepID=UPI0037C15A75